MKKVLFVATITKHINTFHIPYLKWFKEQGYEVHVASNGEQKIEYCDKHYNLPFERFPLKRNNFKVYKQLKKIIKENEYQIIHCHTPVGGVLTRLAARETRKKETKVIYTSHGFHFYKGASLLNWSIYYPIEKICARYTDCLITINEEDYNLAKRKLKAKRIEFVHGVGLNTDRLNIQNEEEVEIKYRQKLNIKENETVLCYIAELNKNKNQMLIIKSLQKLIQEGYILKLLLVGEGDLHETYQKYINENNLNNNIQLLGRRNDIGEILTVTDIYVASSIREGLGVNLMEAIYKKLPIIATDNRGHKELVKNGINGYLVSDYKNIEEFKENIKKLLDDKQKVVKLKENSEKILEKYILNSVMREMEKIYKTI